MTQIKDYNYLSMDDKSWQALLNGEKAFLLGEILRHINDEEAYYEEWLYYYPDGASVEDCFEYFGENAAYQELEQVFIRIYSNKEYHDSGLFSSTLVPSQVVKAAHYWDNRLNLTSIVVYEK